MTLALVFPGQGAQNTGFLHRLPEHDAVRKTLDEASSTLGLDALTLDTTDALRSTVAVQVAMTIAGVAGAPPRATGGLNAEFYSGLWVRAYTAAGRCGAV